MQEILRIHREMLDYANNQNALKCSEDWPHEMVFEVPVQQMIDWFNTIKEFWPWEAEETTCRQ